MAYINKETKEQEFKQSAKDVTLQRASGILKAQLRDELYRLMDAVIEHGQLAGSTLSLDVDDRAISIRSVALAKKVQAYRALKNITVEDESAGNTQRSAASRLCSSIGQTLKHAIRKGEMAVGDPVPDAVIDRIVKNNPFLADKDGNLIQATRDMLRRAHQLTEGELTAIVLGLPDSYPEAPEPTE